MSTSECVFTMLHGGDMKYSFYKLIRYKSKNGTRTSNKSRYKNLKHF